MSILLGSAMARRPVAALPTEGNWSLEPNYERLSLTRGLTTDEHSLALRAQGMRDDWIAKVARHSVLS